MVSGATTSSKKRKLGQRDGLWDMIVDNDDICFKHVLPRLNQTDVKFLYDVNTETRALITRSSRKEELRKAFKVEEMSSISTLEFAWDEIEWGTKARNGRARDQAWFCSRVAKTNKLELLKWAREEKKCEWDYRTIAEAARRGNMEMIKYCLAKECPVNETACAYAAGDGHLECLKYLHEVAKAPWGWGTASAAAQNGHLHILEYLVERKCKKFDEYTCVCAASNGQLDCLKYLHEVVKAPWDSETFYSAAFNGHLHILEYLVERECELDLQCSYVVSQGHLDCLKYLHEVAKVPWDYRTAREAVLGGHFHILEYLVERKYEHFDEKLCSEAAEDGDLDCLKYLHEVAEAPWDWETASAAAENGNLHILEYLVEQNYDKFDEFACAYAAWSGHLDCLKYLREVAKAPWDADAVAGAHVRGKLKCLLYLLDNGCPLPEGWRYEDGTLHVPQQDA